MLCLHPFLKRSRRDLLLLLAEPARWNLGLFALLGQPAQALGFVLEILIEDCRLMMGALQALDSGVIFRVFFIPILLPIIANTRIELTFGRIGDDLIANHAKLRYSVTRDVPLAKGNTEFLRVAVSHQNTSPPTRTPTAKTAAV